MPSNTRAHFLRVAPNKVNKIEDALRLDRIYIGWKAAGLLDPDATERDFKAAVSISFPQYSTNQVGIAVSHLWRFIREMAEGDLVIVPPKDPLRQFFYIAKVDGAPRYYRGTDPDIALERPVQWLHGKQPFLRKDVSRALNSLIKRRPTSLAVTNKDLLREIASLIGDEMFSYPDELVDPAEFPQRAKKQVIVNAYERNPLARAACIQIYGTKCQVCDFDFQAQYGDYGAELIHVHHLTPVSQLHEGYRVIRKQTCAPYAQTATQSSIEGKHRSQLQRLDGWCAVASRGSQRGEPTARVAAGKVYLLL